MKKLFIISIIILFANGLFAQSGVYKTGTAPYYQKNVRIADTLGVNNVFILSGDTVPNLTTFVNTKIAESGGGTDTTSLSNRIDLKANISDTLTYIATKTDIAGIVPIDTTFLRNDINLNAANILLKADSADNATRTFVTNQGYLTSFTELDPIWKADTVNVPRLATSNTFTKANTFNSSVILPNITATTTADSIISIEDNILKKTPLNDINKSTINKLTTDSLIVNSIVTIGGESVYISKQLMTDESSIILPSATTGGGRIIVGTGATWVNFHWQTDGTVILESNSTDVVSTDTDTKFCIFDSGTTITIRNRLGSQQYARFNLTYSTN